jgi:hypothetical protein
MTPFGDLDATLLSTKIAPSALPVVPTRKPMSLTVAKSCCGGRGARQPT